MLPPTSAVIRLGNAESPSNGKDSSSLLEVTVGKKEELSSALASVAPASLDSVQVKVKSQDLDALYDPLALSELVPFLKSGGTVSICIDDVSPECNPDVAVINTSFLLAGLTPESERRGNSGARIMTARKPLSATAAQSAPLKKAVKTNQRVILDGLDNDEDNLIDEDTLLEELAPPPELQSRTATDDCGGREPCDNCTCGRADQKEDASAKHKTKNVPSSSCGKCGLGDAFRCASCPYLGKPAFKPGEEHLVLELTDDI